MTAAEQKDTIEKLKTGKVDIVVGTHRLLSEDVNFKDLGLLIIDEEQRFGVSHKEKIKKLRVGVDVLTMTATPIPRTLHMSLSGIRDISMIETPPEERFPVQTFVTEYEEDMIRGAIERELSRAGQVYFVYNRVQTIDMMKRKLLELMPRLRVAVGHGQMPGTALENVMIDFLDKKYDVLLATTIIENGIDIPNVNTLIVYDTDKFGLSQLYQLRGRVGRSNRLSYAYLTWRPSNILSDTARQRLEAISQFTEFGSGLKIAMRDLEIRGAGSILGRTAARTHDGRGLRTLLQAYRRGGAHHKGRGNRGDFRRCHAQCAGGCFHTRRLYRGRAGQDGRIPRHIHHHKSERQDRDALRHGGPLRQAAACRP